MQLVFVGCMLIKCGSKMEVEYMQLMFVGCMLIKCGCKMEVGMYATRVRGLHVDQMWIQNGGWNICNSCSWAAC